MPLALGTVVAERYELLRTIKSGGMGAVYEVRDLHAPGPTLALKEMLEGFGEDEEALVRRRFEEEARMLAALSHPGIPAISDFFFREQFGCIVMEFIRGEDLEHELQDYLALTHRPFPAEALVRDVLEILGVLRYLHGQDPPVVHRDLKPANLIRDWETGKVRLVDFGLARFVRSGGMTSQTLVGTLGYCPLEQMQGHSEPRSDLYALGATMHHLLSGKAPKFLDLPPLAEVAPFLDADLCALVDRAVATDAKDRYADVEEMADALEGWLESRQEAPVAAPPAAARVEEEAPPVEPAEPSERRLPVLPVAVLAVAALGVFLLGRGGSPRETPRSAASPARVAVVSAAASPSSSSSSSVERPARLTPAPVPRVEPPRPSPRAAAAPRPGPSPTAQRHPEVAVAPAYPRATGSRPQATASPSPTVEPPRPAATYAPSSPPPQAPPRLVDFDRPPLDTLELGSAVNMEDPPHRLQVWMVELPEKRLLSSVVEAAALESRDGGWQVGSPSQLPHDVVAVPMRGKGVQAMLLVGAMAMPDKTLRAVVGRAEAPDGLRAERQLQELLDLYMKRMVESQGPVPGVPMPGGPMPGGPP